MFCFDYLPKLVSCLHTKGIRTPFLGILRIHGVGILQTLYFKITWYWIPSNENTVLAFPMVIVSL